MNRSQILHTYEGALSLFWWMFAG